MASYRLGGVKATFDQKCDYLDDLISSDHSLGIFVAQALYRLSWREVQLIGSIMVDMKNEEDKAKLALYIKETEQAYGIRTDEETKNA